MLLETVRYMAGLNFVGNASYYDVEEGKENIAHFEFILFYSFPLFSFLILYIIM